MAADATAHAWIRNRSVLEGLPLRARPRASPVKITCPVSNMPASIMLGTSWCRAAKTNRNWPHHDT